MSVRCPRCESEQVIRNGSIHNGTPKFLCKACRRQFVEAPKKKVIPQEMWDLVDKLLLERVPIAGIHRITGISETWLQHVINTKYDRVPRHVEVAKKKRVS